MKERGKITFIDLVIPLSCIYMSGLLFWSYFIDDGSRDSPFMDVIIIGVCSGFFVYGVIAFFRDLKLFGFKWMLKSWKKLINK